MMPSKSSVRFVLAILSAVAVAPSASALQIVLVPDAGLAANTAALASFRAAADMWQNAFTDNITVTINAGLSSSFSNANIIGSTSSVTLQSGYTAVRNALVADAADEASNGIVSFLPTSTQFGAFVSGSSINGNVLFTKANGKALGMTGLDTTFGTSDATITFNSNFSFDYDRSNGQTPNTEDFETVAEHEIGHALGFISGVDSNTGTAAARLSTLDLFRFSVAPTTAAEFTTNARELRQGQAATFSDTVNNYRLSTAGNDNGYTYQASHWRADEITGQFIGLMDPSLDYGQAYDYTAADLRAFDLIGWDLRVQATPEPSALAALGLGALAVLRRRKRTA